MNDEQRTVTGTLAGIMEKPNDWKELHIAIPGKEYPVKMSTKKAELVELARAAGDNVMEWTYTEKDSGTPNPHRPGENFKNRWFEGVAPVGTTQVPQNANGSPTSAASSEPVDWDAKERRDYRSRAWAQTLAAFTHTIKVDEDPVAVFLRLQPFQRKVYEDVTQSFAYPVDERDIPF